MKYESQFEVITGPMFAGKSEELIRRLKRLTYAGQYSAPFKPKNDTYNQSRIRSKGGGEMEAIEIDVDHPEQLIAELKRREKKVGRVSVVALDEAQLYASDSAMPQILVDLKRQGYRIIVAGLDLDFRGQPFGMMGKILCMAEDVTKLTSVCASCGSSNGRYSQRFIDGELASWDSPTILVGGQESYKARCETCFIVPHVANGSSHQQLAATP